MRLLHCGGIDYGVDYGNEKFGLSWNQCKYFSHMSIRDFNKKERIKRERVLEELKEI